jgi:hypothetical protein
MRLILSCLLLVVSGCSSTPGRVYLCEPDGSGCRPEPGVTVSEVRAARACLAEWSNGARESARSCFERWEKFENDYRGMNAGADPHLQELRGQILKAR